MPHNRGCPLCTCQSRMFSDSNHPLLVCSPRHYGRITPGGGYRYVPTCTDYLTRPYPLSMHSWKRSWNISSELEIYFWHSFHNNYGRRGSIPMKTVKQFCFLAACQPSVNGQSSVFIDSLSPPSTQNARKWNTRIRRHISIAYMNNTERRYRSQSHGYFFPILWWGFSHLSRDHRPT